jgi:sigma-B regulation protein RsbU (phosphoserine phosphatase)
MAHLSALVRSSLESPVPVNDLVRRIDRHLSERTPSSHFVTLVCGRANAAGEVELCNAGHCLPMVVGPGGTERLNGSDGCPICIGEPGSYQTRRLRLSPGESLVLYTDGVTETRNATNTLYGADALAAVLHANHAQSPARMAEACLSEIRSFRNGTSATDDVTLMVMRRCG